MRVLFIVPPYPIEEYPALATGSVYLASVLRDQGHSVKVLDLLISEPNPEKVSRAVEEQDPDLVGITSVTMTFPMATRIASWAKEAKSSTIVALGGPHVTFVPERSLMECPEADLIVRGEAEETILELVEALEKGRDLREVKGITFREKGGFLSTPDRPLLRDLDSLPPPAWDLLPLARYRVLRGKVGVLSSRGCPYGCIFCVGHKMVGKKGRFRDPAKVVDEMEWLAKRGFTSIGIDDDLFTLRRGHALAICEELASRRLPITWHTFARVDTVDEELLGAMAKAGCTDLLYGVESGSQEILDGIGKKITLEQVRKAVRMAENAGIRVFASFILGLPGETRDSLKLTRDFARSLGCKYGFHVLAPFPGTKIWENPQAFGMKILTERWDHYDANRVITLTDGLSPRDVERILEEYDQGISRYCYVQEKKVMDGIASAQEIEEVRLRNVIRPLAWEILRRDLLEKEGLIKGSISRDEAFGELCSRLSERVPFSKEQVSDAMGEWGREGLLKAQRISDGWLFRWASNEELVNDSGAQDWETP